MSNLTNRPLPNQQADVFLCKLNRFAEPCFMAEIQRNKHYSIIWITEGSGSLRTGFSEHKFQENSIFAFAPMQPFKFYIDTAVKGVMIDFHPGFYCVQEPGIEKIFRQVLYDNTEDAPFVQPGNKGTPALNILFANIEAELKNASLAQNEIIISYLKILLITVSRLKVVQQPLCTGIGHGKGIKEHPILQRLELAIEENFRVKHSPGEYAAMLFVTPKTLAKVSRSYYNKSTSDIIAERIMTEAKRELNLTNKAVKEIAYELGFEDEYYFSRFFKVNAQVSPQKYRAATAIQPPDFDCFTNLLGKRSERQGKLSIP